MAIVKPFKGIRPPKELVEQVESRPYDVLNSEEARASSNPRLTSLRGPASMIPASMRKPLRTSRSSRIRAGLYRTRRSSIISMHRR